MCMFFFSDVGYCDHSICKITSPVLCNLIILHDIGIWNEQGKTMDPQLSTETLKNLTKDIYLLMINSQIITSITTENTVKLQ